MPLRISRRNCALFCGARRELGAFINFDMESYAHKNATLELFKTLFMEPSSATGHTRELSSRRICAMPERDLRDLIAWGRERGTRFTVRLVKGAYWDYEKIKALPKRLAYSGLSAKAGERRKFRDTHAHSARERSRSSLLPSVRITSAASPTRRHSRSNSDRRSRFEFQLLYGMAGPIKRALVEWVIVCANIVRSASCFRACLISFGACSRTLPTKDFCARNFPTMLRRPSYCAIRMNSLGAMAPAPMEDTLYRSRRSSIMQTVLPSTRRPVTPTKMHHS